MIFYFIKYILINFFKLIYYQAVKSDRETRFGSDLYEVLRVPGGGSRRSLKGQPGGDFSLERPQLRVECEKRRRSSP